MNITIEQLINPILVYQMGKVASRTIYDTLEVIEGVNVYHVHRLNPVTIEAARKHHLDRGAKRPISDDVGLFLYENLIRPQKPAKIISLVREPIGRNVSAYFQNLDVFECVKNAHERFKLDELINNFLEKYSHGIPSVWFDIEMKCVLDIDVYAYDFPKEKGYQKITKSPYELLLLRHDLDDSKKVALLSDFLDLSNISLKISNRARSKKYSEVYMKFLEMIKLPTDYIERLLSSKYARHFFAQDELDLIKKKWMKN